MTTSATPPLAMIALRQADVETSTPTPGARMHTAGLPTGPPVTIDDAESQGRPDHVPAQQPAAGTHRTCWSIADPLRPTRLIWEWSYL